LKQDPPDLSLPSSQITGKSRWLTVYFSMQFLKSIPTPTHGKRLKSACAKSLINVGLGN
jgi:hypothetical protein